MPQQEAVPAVGAASSVGLESPRKSLGDSPLGVQGFGGFSNVELDFSFNSVFTM